MFILIGWLNFKKFYTNISMGNRVSVLPWASLMFLWSNLLRLLIDFAPLWLLYIQKLYFFSIFCHCFYYLCLVIYHPELTRTRIMYIFHVSVIWLELSWKVIQLHSVVKAGISKMAFLTCLESWQGELKGWNILQSCVVFLRQ